MIGSDHVPRHRSAKERDIWKASAGFPGLVLAVANPQTRVHLLESVARKSALIARLAQAADVAFAQFVLLTPLPGTLDFEKWERTVENPPMVDDVPLTRHWLLPSSRRPKVYMPHPHLTPEEIRTTSDPSTFFFIGDRSRRNVLDKRLAVLDRPKPQIRYELLVIQHRRGENENREVALTSSMLTGGERNAFLGSIGKLLSLRFDILSAFGYLFAVNLNADLASARARILADTTLNGISGQKITFRNTDTYRYRDALVNPDTGHLDPTGVVREITSGLIIGIDGWVSGANVITMNISSTVSARGTDTSGTTNALPSTTEKLITTHVRTRSGIPVVIGGLLERTTETRIDKVPLLGDIPLIGRLFRKRVTSSQDSELAVYILPHVERGPRESQPLSSRLEAIYERLVGGEQDG